MAQKYTKEFKETIAHLHESGKPVSELLKDGSNEKGLTIFRNRWNMR